MILDAFERYKHNLYLSPITSETIERLGGRCGLSPASNVLDACCGKGGAGLTLARRFGCQVTGVEARAEFVEEARRRALFEDLGHLVDIIEAPAGDLPFDDAYFDLALMLGAAHPYDSGRAARELARVVRPGGRVALSEVVWKPGGRERAGEAVRSWLGRFVPWEVGEVEDLRARYREAGFRVEAADLEADGAWERFYACQAGAILENRREHKSSPEAQSTLDLWQADLEAYHSGGGRESLGYACFLLRPP